MCLTSSPIIGCSIPILDHKMFVGWLNKIQIGHAYLRPEHFTARCRITNTIYLPQSQPLFWDISLVNLYNCKK